MSINNNSILITGAAGFIGAALSIRLLKEDFKVIGIDNINSYYDKNLKYSRLKEIQKVVKFTSQWKFYEESIENYARLSEIFQNNQPKLVVNLAAQAGVRYSINNPSAYIQSNLVGFGNILECCRNFNIEHLIYASSSSVYGGNKKLPFNENDSVDHPISVYAATKKSNELLAHTYSYLFNIPTTGLRFFTVYGPWGRPDMAPMIFADAISNQKIINVNNFGKMKRDFTFIDDIIESLFLCCMKEVNNLKSKDKKKSGSLKATPYRIFNIGNSKPVELIYFIEIIEKFFNKKAIKNFQDLPPGDIITTYADTKSLENWLGYKPSTSIEKGMEIFLKWFQNYYKN